MNIVTDIVSALTAPIKDTVLALVGTLVDGTAALFYDATANTGAGGLTIYATLFLVFMGIGIALSMFFGVVKFGKMGK